jgi:LCP family protein required for cell wall assembly
MKRHNRIKKVLKFVLIIIAGFIIITGLSTYMILHNYINKINLIGINKSQNSAEQESQISVDGNNQASVQGEIVESDNAANTAGTDENSQPQTDSSASEYEVVQSFQDQLSNIQVQSEFDAQFRPTWQEQDNNTGLGSNSQSGVNVRQADNTNQTDNSGQTSITGQTNNTGQANITGSVYNSRQADSVGKAVTSENVQAPWKPVTEVIADDSVMNLLLIGTDVKSSNNTNTECLALFTVNRKSKKLITTTISNNLYLEIPGIGKNRLVTAYRTGGAELLADTIEMNFGIRVDGYVMTDYSTYIEIVDTISGVDVKIADAELEPVNRNIREINKQLEAKADADLLMADGSYNLNGKQALAYSRSWYSDDGDYISPGKQKVIILAILDKVKKFNIIELNGFLNAVLPNISTNLPEKSIMELILMLPVYFKYDIAYFTLPVKGTENKIRKEGYTVLDIDMQKNISELHESLYNN